MYRVLALLFFHDYLILDLWNKRNLNGPDWKHAEILSGCGLWTSPPMGVSVSMGLWDILTNEGYICAAFTTKILD